MPTLRIKRKIHELRQQPQHVRLRMATLLTAGSGGVLVVLWLAVFLPLQLRFNQSDDTTVFPENILQQAAQKGPQLGESPSLGNPNPARVGGIRATATPRPLAQPSYAATPAPQLPLSATPSPTPSTPPTVPVEVIP